MFIKPSLYLRLVTVLTLAMALFSPCLAASCLDDDPLLVKLDELVLQMPRSRSVHVAGSGSVSMNDGRMLVPVRAGDVIAVDGQPATGGEIAVGSGSTVTVTRGDEVVWTIRVGDMPGQTGAVRGVVQSAVQGAVQGAVHGQAGETAELFRRAAVGSGSAQGVSVGGAAQGGGAIGSVGGIARSGQSGNTQVASVSGGRARLYGLLDQARAGVSGGGRGRVIIGVVTREPDGTLAAHLGLDPQQSLVINQVTAGLPAEQAGLKAHDIIVAVDGETVVTKDSLGTIIRSHEPGEAVQITILRGGQRQEILVPVIEATNSVVGLGGSRSGVVVGGINVDAGARDNLLASVARYNLLKSRLDTGLTDLSDGSEALSQAYAQLRRQQDGLTSTEQRLAESLDALTRAKQLGAAALEQGQATAAFDAVKQQQQANNLIDSLRQQLAARGDESRAAARALEQARVLQADRELALVDMSSAARALEQAVAAERGVEFWRNDQTGDSVLLPRRYEQLLAGQVAGQAAANSAQAGTVRLGQLEQRMESLEALLKDWMARQEQQGKQGGVR